MKKSVICAIITMSLSAFALQPAFAEVVTSVEKSFKTPEKPLDLSATADGSKTFVLTNKGNVLIYDTEGNMTDKVSVGKAFDRLDVSPEGSSLTLSSGKDSTVQVISLNFIKQIDIAGSPYKGAKDAPVIIAVFSDFQ